MSADLAQPTALSPELRVAFSSYAREFGCPPAALWHVPGVVTLLANGPLRLTVTAPWGAVAAVGPAEDGVLELVRVERPGERDRLSLADAVAGDGPAWAGGALATARAGARLVIVSQLPEGTGAGAAAAVGQVIRLCLSQPSPSPADVHATRCALLGSRRVSCDLGAAGLRLVLVDTRVRSTARNAPAEDSPVAAAAVAADAAVFAHLGRLLTTAHRALPCDDVQHAAVLAALRAGALGARAIADGPGRPVLALAPANCLPALRAAIGQDLSRAGQRPPRFLTFTPGPGSSRLPIES